MTATESTRYFPGDAWNATCLLKPNLSTAQLEALESRSGIEMPIPDDCPVVVTDSTTGHCSCPDTSPITSGEPLRLRSISRALHLSRTKLLLRATGEWLWFTTEFESWRSPNENSFLWIFGSPGSGKSVLTSAVIRYLENDKKRGDVVAFYCSDGRYESSNPVSEILTGLLLELQGRMTGHSMMARLKKDVEGQEHAHGQLSLATLRSLFMAIKHTLKEEETLILILDGVDDVQGGDKLLQELLTLACQHEKSHRIKILMSSTREFAVRSGIKATLHIDMDTRTSVSDDMKDYTESIVSKNWVSSYEGTAIRERAEKSKGKFLCMTLLLLILPRGSPSADIDDWLVSVMGGNGTNDPFAIYNYMYQSIPQTHHRFALYMLQWVLHAARPMYSWELLDAVNWELGTRFQDSDVEKATMGLLQISRTRTVNLVHLSLREYFQRMQLIPLPHNPEEMITRACLGALSPALILQSLDQPWSGNHNTDIQSSQPNTLEVYAKRYWIDHYLRAEPRSTCTSGLLHETLRKILPAREIRLRNDPKLESARPKTLLEIENARLEPTSLDTANRVLRIAASFGFYKLAKLELDMGATDHITSNSNENSFHLAAKAGHASLVKLFIEYGADVTSLCKSGVTPLFHAIASGHPEVMQLLLELGSSSAAGAQTYESMEELRLEPVISERCYICGHRKTSFRVSFRSLCHPPYLSPSLNASVEIFNRIQLIDQWISKR